MSLVCRWRGCAAPGPFSDDKALYEHLQSTHNPKTCFRCLWDGCTRASELRGSAHLVTHTSYRPFVCGRPACKWAFAREDALKRHIARIHGDEAPYGLGYFETSESQWDRLCILSGNDYLPTRVCKGDYLLVVEHPDARSVGQRGKDGRDEERANNVDGPDPEEADAEQRLERIARLEAALAVLEAKHSVEDEAEHDDDWVFYR